MQLVSGASVVGHKSCGSITVSRALGCRLVMLSLVYREKIWAAFCIRCQLFAFICEPQHRIKWDQGAGGKKNGPLDGVDARSRRSLAVQSGLITTLYVTFQVFFFLGEKENSFTAMYLYRFWACENASFWPLWSVLIAIDGVVEEKIVLGQYVRSQVKIVGKHFYVVVIYPTWYANKHGRSIEVH